MSTESQRLRDAIRSGDIACRCYRSEEQSGDYHQPNCCWNVAVQKIYKLERAENHCHLCKCELNDPTKPGSLDCGGDCLDCMRREEEQMT